MASTSSHLSAGNAEQGSVAGLLTRLMDDAVALAKNEIAPAKAEGRGAPSDAQKSIGPIVNAAGAPVAGALTLVAAMGLALAEVMEPWLAALIVSVGLLLIGWMLLK